MVACICVFVLLFFSFFSSQAGKLKSRGPAWGSGGRSCLSTVVLAFSSFVFIVFSEPNLHNPVAFLKTRAPQPSSPSSSTPVAGSTVHVGRQSPARGVYAPESSLFFGVRDGHAPPFSGHARWGCGLWWLIYGWVAPVTARAPTRRHLRQSPPLPLLPAAWFLCFLFVCVVYSLVQIAWVLLTFYWNICWLDARSTLFYLGVCVNVREAQM
jgi:hypothetical protein